MSFSACETVVGNLQLLLTLHSTDFLAGRQPRQPAAAASKMAWIHGNSAFVLLSCFAMACIYSGIVLLLCSFGGTTNKEIRLILPFAQFMRPKTVNEEELGLLFFLSDSYKKSMCRISGQFFLSAIIIMSTFGTAVGCSHRFFHSWFGLLTGFWPYELSESKD